MDIGVDEPDHVARRLYESLGFTNRTGGPDGPVMFVYERELLGHRERTPILARDSGSDRVPEAGNVGRDGMRSDPPRRSLMPLSGCLLSEVRPGRPWLGPLGRSRLAGCGQVEEGAASFVQP